MLKSLKKLLLLYRIAALGKSLAISSTPLLLAGCLIILADRREMVELHGEATSAILVSLAIVAWIPLYSRYRGSLLGMARRIDSIASSRGIVTAGADVASSIRVPSAWGRLVQEEGARVLSSASSRMVVPMRGFAAFIPPAAAALLFAAAYDLAATKVEGNRIEWKEKNELAPGMRLFNTVDEKLLEKVHRRLKNDLDRNGSARGDATMGDLRKRIEKALSSFPENEKDLHEYMKMVDDLKTRMEKFEQDNLKELDILQQAGEKIDSMLLEELGKAMEKKHLGEAAESAEEAASKIEKSPPSQKNMKEAASDLKEASLEGLKEMGGGEKEESEGGKAGGEGMDSEKFDKLKKFLEKLDKLAGMFDLKDKSGIPEGLKELAKDLSDMNVSQKQANELGDLADKLENLKNMMLEAKEGKGKEKYGSLRAQFEKAAGGKEEGSPGHAGSSAAGLYPGGIQMKPGESAGQDSAKDSGAAYRGSKDDTGPEKPGSGPAAAENKEGWKKGQEGWGTGSTPHLGEAVGQDHDTTFEDIELKSKDSPGPLKKEVVKGAAKDGFAGKSYKKVYENYASIIEEILEEENVPPLYRYYVNKYFELVYPR